MKVRNYLENITGIGIYPVITLIMFFLFFSLLVAWVIRARKHHYTHLSNLPLEGEQPNTNQPKHLS